MRVCAFDRALDAVWAFVADANRYVTEEEPWALAKRAASAEDPEAATAWTAKLNGSLFSLAAALDATAECIAPLLPGTSRRLAEKLETANQAATNALAAVAGCRVQKGAPLFPKL